MAILDSSSVTWLMAGYILVISAVSFYIIYLGARTQFINDNKWVSSKNLNNETERDPLRQMRDVPYNLAIPMVVINFFIITAMIFNKFKITIRN
jgi:hypothetical protein